MQRYDTEDLSWLVKDDKGPLVLFADMDRLRKDARERVAAYMVNEQGYVETYATKVADDILSAIFQEASE